MCIRMRDIFFAFFITVLTVNKCFVDYHKNKSVLLHIRTNICALSTRVYIKVIDNF